MANKPLKIIFAGTPAFAAIALQGLLSSSHQVIAVYTQPDKPAGRGLKLTASAVKELAQLHQLPIYQPSTLKTPEAQAELASLNADVMVVAAYGLILPKAILEIPRLGCVNIHPSLLPRWRGAAPIQRTIFAGDKKTGVAIMQMDEGLDTGPVYLQHDYTLAAHETTPTLHDKLAEIGSHVLIETLDLLAENNITATPQDNANVTYAQKITKEEAHINWQQTAEQIDCLVRAFQPWPVAFTQWQGQAMRVWMTSVLNEKSTQAPGTIIRAAKEGIDVATGDGVLRLTHLQLPGGKAMSAADFYNAQQNKLKLGEQLQ